jgi:predicted DNA-binding transcriptional regulator YafY
MPSKWLLSQNGRAPMSYKFDSLMIILNKIDSGEVVTIQSLSDEFGVGRRSIFRYINTLQVAGYPIAYDRQQERYCFSEGYSLKKPGMSLEEGLALALSKKVLEGFGDGLVKSINGIEEKLSGKKAGSSKTYIFSTGTPPPNAAQYIGRIHQAIVNFQRLELVYTSLYSKEETTRKIDPYYLFFEDSFWYLRGYCRLREGFRTFALDQIRSLKLLSEHFVPENISPDEELAGSFGTFVDGESVEVVLRIQPEIKSQVLRKKWHPSQKERVMKNGSLELKFNINGWDGIKPWIYRWLPWITIIAPRELQEAVKKDLDQALSQNSR